MVVGVSEYKCVICIFQGAKVVKTAKITVFDPVICKTTDAPLQDQLLF